jgi:hypothetical protein
MRKQKLTGEERKSRLKASRLKYYYSNRQAIALGRRERYYSDHEKIKEYKRAWFRSNPEKVKEYTQTRKRNNPGYWNLFSPRRKLANNLRNLVKSAFRYRSVAKSGKTVELIGCDIPWLIAWLEVQFLPGMTLDNHGTAWEIEHRRPCASFDLTDPIEQRKCFHWTNLQPMEPALNRIKGASWEG